MKKIVVMAVIALLPLFTWGCSKKEVSKEVTKESVVETSESTSERVADYSKIKTLFDQKVKAVDGKSSYYFKDLSSNEDISVGNQKQRSASVIKLFILSAFYEAVNEGELDDKTMLTISENDLTGGTDIIQKVGVGIEYTLADLARLMIVESDNTAARIY